MAFRKRTAIVGQSRSAVAPTGLVSAAAGRVLPVSASRPTRPRPATRRAGHPARHVFASPGHRSPPAARQRPEPCVSPAIVSVGHRAIAPPRRASDGDPRQAGQNRRDRLRSPAGRKGTTAVRLLLVRFVLAEIRGSFHQPVIPQEQNHVLPPGIGSLGKAGSGSAIQTSESAPGSNCGNNTSFSSRICSVRSSTNSARRS